LRERPEEVNRTRARQPRTKRDRHTIVLLTDILDESEPALRGLHAIALAISGPGRSVEALCLAARRFCGSKR
jgi:hypothetical protein